MSSMLPYIARPHPFADKFVRSHFGDSFGQLPFVHGDPLANQFDGSFLIGFICKEIPHDSRFSLGIESRNPHVPACCHLRSRLIQPGPLPAYSRLGKESPRSGWIPRRQSAELLGGTAEQLAELIVPAIVRGSKYPAGCACLIQPDFAAPAYVDRVFRPLLTSAFDKPEVGMRVVRGAAVQIQIEADGNMVLLKLAIALFHRWNQKVANPLHAAPEFLRTRVILLRP